MAAPLSSWPWTSLGQYKYALLGPLVWKVVQEWREQGALPLALGSWWLHLLLLFVVRGLTYQFWFTYGNMLFFTRRRRVVADGVDFRQIDAEWDWDNFLVLQTLLGATVVNSPLLPGLQQLCLWDLRGWAVALLLHVGFSEPVFYLAHRALHRAPLFARYHAKHHSSGVATQPLTAGFGTPLEVLLLTLVMGVPLAGAFMVGAGSIGLVYVHALAFDYLRAMGYSNVEVVSPRVFEAFPLLRYILYTPSYLSLHHRERRGNFCLFMPALDWLGGTLDSRAWPLQRAAYDGEHGGGALGTPGFVFLAHVVDIMSSMHVPFALRSLSSTPFANHFFLLPFWPLAFSFMLLMWCCSKTFVVSFYCLRGQLHQTWSVPRYGFQYFLPAAKKGINKQIELAILRADKMGVKVLSLAALNKRSLVLARPPSNYSTKGMHACGRIELKGRSPATTRGRDETHGRPYGTDVWPGAQLTAPPPLMAKMRMESKTSVMRASMILLMMRSRRGCGAEGQVRECDGREPAPTAGPRAVLVAHRTTRPARSREARVAWQWQQCGRGSCMHV